MSPNALVELTIDGKRVSVPAGTTVFDAARMNGISIPTLCHQQNETPVGVCRVCVVDVGRPIYAASCVRPVEPSLVVTTNSDKVIQARRTLLELLMSDHPTPCLRQQHSRDCELEALAKQASITQPRFARRTVAHGNDDSSLAIAVNFDACILCDRCIRGCNEVRGNFVLGRMGKGAQAGIAFDHNLPMGDSSCVSCGECMVSCPTGALTNKKTLPIDAGPDHNAKIAEPDELLQLPVFKGVSGTFLELNKGAMRGLGLVFLAYALRFDRVAFVQLLKTAYYLLNDRMAIGSVTVGLGYFTEGLALGPLYRLKRPPRLLDRSPGADRKALTIGFLPVEPRLPI